MKTINVTLTTILLGLGWLLPQVQAADDAPAQKKFTQIDMPGALFTVANGINARGDIVGAYVDSNGRLHGFLLSNASFTTIDPPGANLTVPLHINPEGVITGLYRRSNGNIHGFLLSNGEFMTVQKPGTTFTEIGRAHV